MLLNRVRWNETDDSNISNNRNTTIERSQSNLASNTPYILSNVNNRVNDYNVRNSSTYVPTASEVAMDNQSIFRFFFA